MKFATVLAFAIGAFALPQDAAVTSAPTSTASAGSGLTPAVSCALACAAGDVTCQAACLGNARPNASQAIDTNECAAKCDQGDGSKEASEAYGKCVQGCIGSLFPSSQTAFNGGAAVASAAASAAASVTNSVGATATASGSTKSASATGSESGSAASAKSTGAADKTSAHLAGAGLAGLLAVFAL